jgi:hypothetical protein
MSITFMYRLFKFGGGCDSKWMDPGIEFDSSDGPVVISISESPLKIKGTMGDTIESDDSRDRACSMTCGSIFVSRQLCGIRPGDWYDRRSNRP